MTGIDTSYKPKFLGLLTVTYNPLEKCERILCFTLICTISENPA